MADDTLDSSPNRSIARETLANLRNILKGDTSTAAMHSSGRSDDAARKLADEPDQPYSGTVEDLIHSIECARANGADGFEYWSSRTLMRILGYGDLGWDKFKEVILKAQYACERSDQRINAHFRAMSVSSPKDGYDDIHVTRYGAYLVAQNGDTRKKQVAFAQTYFATQTRKQQLQDQQISRKDEQRRLAMRDKIAEHNKSLADAARDAGVEAPADFARFQNYGYRGLYNGLDVHGIRNAKLLPASAKILDHMDITELAANFFRATQAEDKLRRENIFGKAEANAAHCEVGRKVRKAITDIGGTMPENLPAVENIDEVRKRVSKLGNET